MIFARALAALLATCLATGAASAQTYPDRPVTMIVAFPPGGADDATARFIQDAIAHRRVKTPRGRGWTKLRARPNRLLWPTTFIIWSDRVDQPACRITGCREMIAVAVAQIERSSGGRRMARCNDRNL